MKTFKDKTKKDRSKNLEDRIKFESEAKIKSKETRIQQERSQNKEERLKN